MLLTEPEQFSTQLIIEVLPEKYGVTKSSLESSRQIDIGGTPGVERETTQWVVAKSVGPLGIVRFHAKLSIRRIDDIARESSYSIGRSQCDVRQGASAVNSLGSGRERLSKLVGEQFVGQRTPPPVLRVWVGLLSWPSPPVEVGTGEEGLTVRDGFMIRIGNSVLDLGTWLGTLFRTGVEFVAGGSDSMLVTTGGLQTRLFSLDLALIMRWLRPKWGVG